MAALSFETSVDIDAPVDEVYAYVADFPRHVEWNYQPIRMTSLSDGPVAVGSRYETVEEFPETLGGGQKLMMRVMMPVMGLIYGTSGRTEAEITALDANERMAWKARMPSKRKGDLMRMRWEIRTEGIDSGTRVTQSCEVDPPEGSPFAGMVNEDMRQTSIEGTSRNLQRLKKILESR